MRAAGFEDVEILYRYENLYADVPDPSSALKYGTQGITFRARRPG